MDINQIFTSLSFPQFISLFFKAFALGFSFIILIYAIVIAKQTQVMNQTLIVGQKNAFGAISTIQIILAIGLFVLAIFII